MTPDKASAFVTEHIKDIGTSHDKSKELMFSPKPPSPRNLIRDLFSNQAVGIDRVLESLADGAPVMLNAFAG